MKYGGGGVNVTETNDVAKQQTELNRLYCENNELYHNLAVSYGISDSVLWILYTLNDLKRPCTPKEIGEMCSLSKQTVHSALQSLERGGYLSMTISPENRKSKQVVLTGKGMKLIGDSIADIVEAEVQAFSGMEDGERRELLRLLEKYQSLFRMEVKRLTEKQLLNTKQME